MWVDRTVDIKKWLEANKKNLKLDLRCEDSRMKFAKEVLDLEKEWGNIVEELNDQNVTSHHIRFQHFNKMIVQTNTTCKERKLGGPIEMMHRMMGFGHIMTGSCIDHNSALMRFDSLTVESMNVPDKQLGSGISKTNQELRECLDRFFDPLQTDLGMFTELISIKMRWISNGTADVSKVCAACKIHSEAIMERKLNVANRSGSSIVGDVVEKFLQSMTLNAIQKSTNMSNAVKCPKPPKSTGKDTDESAWVCKIFEDERWKKYVEKPDDQKAQTAAKELLAIDGLQPPFYFDYDRLSQQPGDLKKNGWHLDGFSRNLIYLIPQLTLIAVATMQNATIHDNKILNLKERIDLTNYIAQYHTGSECMYTASVQLHPDLNTRFDMEFKEQQSFLNNLNPIIGFVVAAGMMTNSCIAEASYPHADRESTPQAKLYVVKNIARRLKSMFNTMDKEATGSRANFEATMIHFSK